ncbi:MAG: Gfo/Idh/MocA family oxidoreductase [Acidimicrobiales bacterium]|nr:Gfo/Idh/MocA family oxidoreductase [Acidimicrobiales bacterium]
MSTLDLDVGVELGPGPGPGPFPGPGSPVDALAGARVVRWARPELADDRTVAAVEQAVRRGARVLAGPAPPGSPAAALLGTAAGEVLPDTEWFVTLGAHPAAARLPLEPRVTAVLSTLTVHAPEATVVATTSVRFAHRPTVVERPLGAGAVVTCGYGPLERALADPDLGRLLRRLLRPPRPPRAPLGVGIVGYGPYGGMGLVHGLAVRDTDGLDLVAVCDASDERRKAAEAELPGVRTTADASELAADVDADVVIVATPPVSHASIALDLLRAGKHVVLEKPMCLRLDDADRLLAEAAAAGRMLTVHQSRRWDTDFLALRRAVERGSLGQVFNIETFVGGFEHPCRAWHSEASVSGGAVYDWGSHHVDWILLLHGGRPARVWCTGHKRVWHDVSNLDQVTVRLQWPDGREATFVQSDVAAVRRPKFYVQGTEGTLEGHYRPLRFERLEPGRGYVDERPHHAEAPVELRLVRHEAGYGLVEQWLPPVAHPGPAFHRNLADHLLLGEPLAVAPSEARDVVAVLQAAQRSSDEGGRAVEPG